MTVLAEFSPEEILKLIRFRTDFYLQKHERINLLGYQVKISTLKLQTFKKSLQCQRCLITGNVFRLETNNGENPHLNLYYVRKNEERLMTKDHIIPLAYGGPNKLTNLQTMCGPCNRLKGSKIKPRYFNYEVRRIITMRNLHINYPQYFQNL